MSEQPAASLAASPDDARRDEGTHGATLVHQEDSPARHSTRRGHGIAFALLVVLLLVTAVLSIYIGTEHLPISRVTASLRGHGDATTDALVWEYRMPRTGVAIAAGTALGVSGAIIQALTRNPLADPGVLGVNAGAALAVTVAVGVIGFGSVTSLLAPALIGAFGATLLVILLASLGRGPGTPVRMTLSGVALAAVFTGLASGIRLSSPTTFDRLLSWSVGSVAGRSMSDLAIVAPFILVAALVAVFLGRALNAMAFGDDQAAGLGVNVTRIRMLTIVCVTVLAGCATAIAGPISFVGLLVAHVVRLLVGNDQTRILALSALGAPSFLLASDILARVVISPREIPVGLVTAFVGAPVLILLVRRKNVVQA